MCARWTPLGNFWKTDFQPTPSVEKLLSQSHSFANFAAAKACKDSAMMGCNYRRALLLRQMLEAPHVLFGWVISTTTEQLHYGKDLVA